MSGNVAVVVLSVFLASLSSILVAARCVARFAIRKEKGVEDGLVILALCCSIIQAALFVIGENTSISCRLRLTKQQSILGIR